MINVFFLLRLQMFYNKGEKKKKIFIHKKDAKKFYKYHVVFLNNLNVITSTFKIDHGFNMQKLCPQKGIGIPGEAKPCYPVIFTEPLLVYSSQTNSRRRFEN